MRQEIHYEDQEVSSSDENDQDTADVVEYPWPCPDNWPLPSSGETPAQDNKSVSSRSSSEVSHAQGYVSPEFQLNDQSATIERVVRAVHVRPTVVSRPSSTLQSSKQDDDDDEVFFWGTKSQIKEVKEEELDDEEDEDDADYVIDFKSPIAYPKPTRSPEKPYAKSIGERSYARSLTGRSFTSTNSSRLRKNRSSIIETYHRKQSNLGFIQERRLHFSAQFKSRRIYEPNLKPWMAESDTALRVIKGIPLIGILIGTLVGAYLIYTGYEGVPKHNFCMTLDETWANGIDPNLWTREVNLGGFGTGEFEWATDSDNNAFVEEGTLYIKPTLTSDVIGEEAVLNGYTVDLTADGTCTGTTSSDCVVTSNSTSKTLINPVQSARLISKGKFSMKYGKIEIKARMPEGDWLWPAIWMLPEDNVYGAWPLSGEIDIAESRGNDIAYSAGGRNVVTTTLHWGPSTTLDAFFRTSNPNTQYHSTFADGFNTFGLEWTDKYLYTYVNNHLRQVFYIKFTEPFFSRGLWPVIDATNKTAIVNPWAGANNDIAPFDQKFYLILNVAVGTSFGFFPDGVGNKPWVDGTSTAMADFYSAKDTWYPTWGKGNKRAMAIESIKAWSICD